MRADQHPYEWPGSPAAAVLLLVAVAAMKDHRDELYFLRADREPAFGLDVDQSAPATPAPQELVQHGAARARTLTGRRRAAAAVDRTLDEAVRKRRGEHQGYRVL